MTSRFDGNDGIDNVFGSDLYPLVESAVPGLEGLAQDAQLDGRGNPVLYVRGWNGTRNDPRIDIAIMPAVFLTSADGPSPTEPPDVTIVSPTEYTLAGGGMVPPPAFDGMDWAWVRDDAFLGGDFEQPLIRDDNAYVADGVFVARLPDRIDIIFPTDEAGVLIRLTGAIATAPLSADGLSLDPLTVGGRWSTTDLLATAENIGVCRSDPRYPVLSNAIARLADVRSMAPDPPDPTLACNAVSIGVTFQATRIRVADVTPGIPLASMCATMTDAGVDPDAGLDAGMPDAGPPDAGPPDAPDIDAP
jgi:hypothetical protein